MEVVHIYLETVDSTNAYAKRHASDFDPKKITCITAEEQTAGRGRYQRQWVSPKGVNLYTTFYFELPSQTRHLTSLGLLLIHSLTTLLIQEELFPKIKWPNDVQLSGKKLSGVLAQTLFSPPSVAIILGIGININMSSDDLSTIDQPATSLLQETGRTWDRKQLLINLQKQFITDLEVFIKQGFTPFHNSFENLLAFKGKTVRYFDGQREWIGLCHSLTDEGALNLLLPDQTIHTFLSGDVNYLN